MFEFLILFIIGFLWGSTNFLIEMTYYDYDKLENLRFFEKSVLFLKKNYKPLIFFLLNQLGSILFYFSLGKINLSLTVIISNTFSFIVNIIFEMIYSKRKFNISNIK